MKCLVDTLSRESERVCMEEEERERETVLLSTFAKVKAHRVLQKCRTPKKSMNQTTETSHTIPKHPVTNRTRPGGHCQAL